MYFDLENRLRTDGEFQEELQRRQERLARLEQLLLRDQGHLAEYHQVLRELLEFCQFNIALLTAYFWPAYPKNKPLLYSDYPFSFQLFSLQIGGFTVIRGSRQISKTTSFACRQQMMARLLRGFRSLYVTPRHEQLQTYKNKFRELEKANRFFQRNTHLRQNLGYKEHENGSIVEMAYVLTSAAGIRGKSTDELLFDEYQNFDPELELEVLQTQSASEMRLALTAEERIRKRTGMSFSMGELSGPPLGAGGLSLLGCIQAACPEWARLCLGEDVWAEPIFDQDAETFFFVMQRGVAPVEAANQLRQSAAFDQRQEDGLAGPVQGSEDQLPVQAAGGSSRGVLDRGCQAVVQGERVLACVVVGDRRVQGAHA
jgi:hypothetical protein